MEAFPPNQKSACGFPYCGYWCYIFHCTQRRSCSRQKMWRLRMDVFRMRTCETYRYNDTNRPYCYYPIHGICCKNLLHKHCRVAPPPSRYFNTAKNSSTSDPAHSKISQDLTEKLEILNAIYGPGSFKVRHSGADSVCLLLKLPIPEAFTFTVTLKSDYPEFISRLQKVVKSLFEKLDRRSQNVYLILFDSLQTSFIPGEPCLFTVLDDALSKISCLRDYFFDVALANLRYQLVQFRDLWWTRKSLIRMEEAESLTECVICCDVFYAF